MNDLQIFKNSDFGELRTIVKEGEPWFVAIDVCKALEIANSRMAVDRLDEDEKDVSLTDTLGGKQQMQIVSESGLYSLALGSRKPQAKPFKRWVTHEVIPSIRKHGAYATPATIESLIQNPESGIKLLTALKEEQDKRKVLEDKVNQDRPKVLFADAVAASESPMLIGELAKVIKQNGVNIGEKRLFEWLRNNGYLIRRKGTDYNSPTQRSMEMGLFKVKETAITHSDGHITVNRTTKVTGRGQRYFVNKFLGSENYDN
ncbi:phage antirepressor [Caproicibacterium sp. BJN0003]|uniref:phage antirepressor n=1 Tax=Caproicibacterium sp. BJN0003 TaxID=2994078 RepID=UPI002258E0C8|nr:phage antirepressor [Caproicibacterium sp. BJN0003]UZT82111.1 phage antirepressor [Caproicibacterium sp. BJN0003]